MSSLRVQSSSSSKARHPAVLLAFLLAVASLLLVVPQVVFRRAPDCAATSPGLEEARGLLARGQAELAAAVAELALQGAGGRPLCRETRDALGALWYEASLRALLGTPRPPTPDAAWEQQLVARWRSIEQRATMLGVPPERRWEPMTLAGLAYSAALWPLADAAFRQAWQARGGSLEAVAFRYALLRNWGRELASSAAPGTRAQGVRLLATARTVATAYSLPHGEACRDLEQLGFADCDEPLPDLREPVLQSRR